MRLTDLLKQIDTPKSKDEALAVEQLKNFEQFQVKFTREKQGNLKKTIKRQNKSSFYIKLQQYTELPEILSTVIRRVEAMPKEGISVDAIDLDVQ